MSKLYYRHGTLSSGKTLALLSANHNYEQQGKNTIIFKPSIDTRSAKGKVESRIGVSADCIDISKTFDIYKYVEAELIIKNNLSAVLVDEAQFLTTRQVEQLKDITTKLGIPVLAYGLKNTYKPNELFEGSIALLFWADKIEELKNVCECEGCNRKATQNLYVVDGKPIYRGETVNIGDVVGEERYYSVCNYHYKNPKIN